MVPGAPPFCEAACFPQVALLEVEVTVSHETFLFTSSISRGAVKSHSSVSPFLSQLYFALFLFSVASIIF